MRYDVDSSNDFSFSANNMSRVILGYCSEYMAPSITATCRYWDEDGSNGLGDGDGLDADHAHKLGTALQCALDDGSIDKLAGELFVDLYHEYGQYVITNYQSLPWLKRKFVDECVSKVKRLA